MSIIKSLLDNDLYAATMSQLAWKYFRSWHVEYEFRNRTFSVPLRNRLSMSWLQEELDAVQDLTLGDEEINYLRSLGYFWEEYLAALKSLALPDVEIGHNGEHLTLKYGKDAEWWQSIWWETMILAMVSEMYYTQFNISLVEGGRRHTAKLEYLDHTPMPFLEFGTRRRFSREWQEYVIADTIKHPCPSMVGTSNMYWAKEYNLHCGGTQAHQLYMVLSAMALADNLPNPIAAGSQSTMFYWNGMYHQFPELMCVLPDTYGSEWFWDNVADEEMFREVPAWRQDSGDPVAWGESLLKRYNQYGIDPANKRIVFSDGLDLRTMNILWDHFSSRINVSYGWGTNFSNDLGLQNLSIVIKPCSVNGNKVVKISDNIQKATGDPKEIQRYVELLHYAPVTDVAPTY